MYTKTVRPCRWQRPLRFHNKLAFVRVMLLVPKPWPEQPSDVQSESLAPFLLQLLDQLLLSWLRHCRQLIPWHLHRVKLDEAAPHREASRMERARLQQPLVLAERPEILGSRRAERP